MKQARSYWERSWRLVGATALGATLIGCEPSNTVPAGAPIMLSFGPLDPDGKPLVLLDEKGVTLPTPALVPFRALFDRLLDPTTLEDTAGHPKAGLATAQSAVAVAGIPVTTNFVPNGDSKNAVLLPPGPSITVSPICGLPSGAAVTVTLDLQKVRSHDQTTLAIAAADATPVLSFMTEPLAVATDLPEAMTDMTTGLPVPPEVDAGQTVNLIFNNRTPGDVPDPACAALLSTKGHIHVAATIAGHPVGDLDAVVAPDPMDPTKWMVSPPGTTPDAAGNWPPGADIKISVDATATDLFAQPLGTEASASFKVKS
jgi:hypothetical protein